MRLVALSVTAIAALAAGSLMAGAAQAQTVMRISHPVPTAHHVHKAVEAFKADLEARTKGTMRVEIFPAEQLAKQSETHASVARGAFEAGVLTNFTWGNTVPEMNVLTIPYLLTDLEKIKKFPGSPAALILEQALLAKGVRNITWFYTTRQSIFTSAKKPLVQLEDLKGLKIRGLSALSDTGLAAIGASPTPTPAPEVYQALQSGVLDAGLTDVSAAVSRRFYEVQKYGTVAPYFSVYFHMFANPAWYNRLTTGEKDALAAAAKKAEADMIGLTEATAEAAIKELPLKGMTIHMQTPAEAAAWKAALQKPVIDAFVKAVPENGPKLIDALNKL
jgi:C4-dicarboxylate-binding protein DctP